VRQQNSGAVEDFILPYFAFLSTNPKVKELLKSVHICQSYRKNKSGTFLWPTVYIEYRLYNDQLASLERHAQLTRCLSAVAELLVNIDVQLIS